MRRWMVVAGGLALFAGPGAAQEIELGPGVTRRLPRSLVDRLRSSPVQFRGGWARRATLARHANQAVTDSLPVAVVNALFSDSPTPHFTHTDLQQQLFSGPSPHGTIAEFYQEASGNRFTIAGQALPWVRTNITRDAAVGDNFGLGGSGDVGTFLVQALTAADSTTDFSIFDNDGPDNVPGSADDDGMVDVVAFHFIEISASCGGNGIWPHRFGISGQTGSPFMTNDTNAVGDTVFVDSYIIQSAVTCNGSDIARSSTLAHELGHVLGLPDYYDSTDGILPEQRRWVMGCWSLMAAGAWGCGQVDRNSVDRPTHLGPWEKDLMGWLSTVELVGPVMDSAFTLQPVMTSERILRIPLNGTDEFLFVEYRTQTGFDVGLPAAGVLVYHIEPSRTRRPCATCAKIYQVSLVEADGDSALTKLAAQGGNRGVAGDAFQTGDRLSSGTRPAIRLNDHTPSSVTIHSVTVTDSVATLRITTEAIGQAMLLEPFLPDAAPPLSAEQIAFLDRYGNQNGRYDVGDLRAYLRDNPVR